MKYLIAFLLVCSLCFCQEYEYDRVFVRGDLGEFVALGKSGKFKLTDSQIELFDQVLSITNKRLLFDEKRNLQGDLYSVTDGTFFYTMLLTSENVLYFYTKENKMLKFNLKPKK